LLEEVKDVCMRPIARWWCRASVECYGLGGVQEGAIGAKGDAGLPVVQIGCATSADTGSEGDLDARGEHGGIDRGFIDGEIDEEEGVSLVRDGGDVGEGWNCRCYCDRLLAEFLRASMERVITRYR